MLSIIKERVNTHENKKGWGRFAPGRKNQKPDALDKKLIYLLTLEGRMSVRAIAKSLEITPPTARSRMEKLIRSGILRIAGLVDPFMVKGITTAIVGVRLELHEQLEDQVKRYLASGNCFKINRETGSVYLSAILDPTWYGKNFIRKYGINRKFKEQPPSTRAVLNFLTNYISESDVRYLEVGNYTLKYFPYDWRINNRH